MLYEEMKSVNKIKEILNGHAKVSKLVKKKRTNNMQ
jgi:hypothetical protein